jgi:hypothetical protein
MMTLEQVKRRLAEDRASLPPLYGPDSPGEDAYLEAANPIAEAEQALSTLNSYLAKARSGVLND